MGLLDLFRRQGAADAATAAASGQPVEAARAQARRRLVGAVVLLGAGVIAFPLLFETQPRPIPVDIPIQIPSRDGAVPLSMPASRPAALVAAASAATPAPAPKVAPPAASLPAASAEPRVEPTRTTAPAKPAPAPAPAPVPVPIEAAPTPKAPASAPKAAASAPKAAEPAVRPGTEAPGRFVVQVGAFAEATAVREARGKLEKLGLPSYTQAVQTASGTRTRVRLGPFGTREEADKAAAKAKTAGLAGTVLAL